MTWGSLWHVVETCTNAPPFANPKTIELTISHNILENLGQKSKKTRLKQCGSAFETTSTNFLSPQLLNLFPAFAKGPARRCRASSVGSPPAIVVPFQRHPAGSWRSLHPGAVGDLGQTAQCLFFAGFGCHKQLPWGWAREKAHGDDFGMVSCWLYHIDTLDII